MAPTDPIIIIITPPPPPHAASETELAGVADSYAKARQLIDDAEESGARVIIR